MAASWYRVLNRSRPLARPLRVRLCATGWCRLRGLMFRVHLDPEEGLLFQWSRPGRWRTAIHMWGMRFPLTLVWVDAHHRVVDVRLGRPWRTVAVPRRPAQYVLELHASRLSEFHLGDHLVWEPLEGTS